MLRLGTMRERLRILAATITKDDHGAEEHTWNQVIDTVDAELVPLRAAERLQAQTMQAQVDTRFRIRSRADITTAMRLEWYPSWLSLATPKTLEIHGLWPDPNDPQSALLVDCGEAVSA